MEASEQFSRALVALIKKARENRGVSQNQLAKLSGVSRSMINHLEGGIRNPTVIVVHALATALEVDLAKLIATTKRAAKPNFLTLD